MQGVIILFTGVIGVLWSLISGYYWHGRSNHKFFLHLFFAAIMCFLVLMGFVGIYANMNHPVVNLASLLFFVNLLLIPPGMYLYTDYYLSESDPNYEFHHLLKHFSPAIFLLILNLTGYIIIYSVDASSELLDVAEWVLFYANAIALLFGFLLQNVYYGYQAFFNYHTHKKNLKEYFSYSEGVALSWIKSFILGYFVLIILMNLQTMGLLGSQNYTLVLFVVLYGIFIFYKGFRQRSFTELMDKAARDGSKQNMDIPDSLSTANPTITSADVPVSPYPTTIRTEKKQPKEKNTNLLEQEQIFEIWDNVCNLMENEKIFLDRELTLHKVAKLANTNTKYLRYTLNHQVQLNFNQFVNKYRVEQAKVLLQDKENLRYNIEFIGEKAGFKSKSAFYQAFKKWVGKTPQQFKKNSTSRTS